ncbi:MAG: hypothetical protein EXS39_00140 [Opitutaceae bacterium]|nr:hypothetical protein [Opitutaceae bacterium]
MQNRLRLPAFVLAAFTLGFVSRSGAQTALQDSPFLPAAGSVLAAGAASFETLQLSGISVVGKKTFVSIFDTEKKHSNWIAVGKAVGGVEIISCDVIGDRAVVRVAGQVKMLLLRRSGAGGAAAPVAAFPGTGSVPPVVLPTMPVAAPTTNAPLNEQAIQEREARMLVSDLLEIGQQQRKAYEEKKAAADAAPRKGG